MKHRRSRKFPHFSGQAVDLNHIQGSSRFLQRDRKGTRANDSSLMRFCLPKSKVECLHGAVTGARGHAACSHTMARRASPRKCLWRLESHHVLLKRRSEGPVQSPKSSWSYVPLFVFRMLRLSVKPKTVRLGDARTRLQFHAFFPFLSAVPPATSFTVTYTQNKGESNCHRVIQIFGT
jgi:hypothetical protein